MMNDDRASQQTDSLDARFWGKERGLPHPYPVVCHLLDTAAAFNVLWDDLLGHHTRERISKALGLTADEARAVVSFWAGLHDLGKITPPFQAQVPHAFAAVRDDPVYGRAPGAEAKGEFRHEVATHWALASLLDEVGYPGNKRLMRLAVSHQVAQLLGGHHGCFGAVLETKKLAAASAYQPGLGEMGWEAQRRVHFAELRRVTGAAAVPERGLPAELAMVIAGMVVVADWLASQTDAIMSIQPPPSWLGTSAELDAHWDRARKAARGWVAEARLGRAVFEAERFGEMFPFAPNDLQSDLITHLPQLVEAQGGGLLLVTAPTGDGKTEAALYAASVMGRAAGARGLYFALPTMATADAMFPRVRGFAANALGGDRALTLLHSMAWLSPVYTGGEQTAEESSRGSEVSADRATAMEAGDWLRGAKRGLLAPLGAGTIDQALSAVLPLTHNALRLFGLSEKVFVVDEAHAYGPWMHQLLTRLLEWLGAFRAPVVLLSATLTGRTAASLVEAYRRGAGFTDPVAVDPCYPGWIFVGAESGEVSAPRATESRRKRTLDVVVRRVTWDVAEDPRTAARSGGRRAALREALQPVAEEGGTALVCCTTVAEAQRTFRDLRVAFPELARREGGLRLLHSRYPAFVRQRITRECEAAYGKPTSNDDIAQPRPGSILVATQVVEQSLDFDFDLIVSDLAPLAQLLQRAGRGLRHERGMTGRPAWALPEDAPRLVVLEPVDAAGDTTAPPSWGQVYDPGLLKRTAGLLAERGAEGIDVPGDVQRLVDAVYAEDFVDQLQEAAGRELRRMDAERHAVEAAEAHLADMVSICAPADVAGDLHKLSRREAGVTEELLTTRLGADSGRVLCLYEQPDGTLTLDEAGTLPLLPSGQHGPSRHGLTQIMGHVAPVPGTWLRGGGEGHPSPKGWDKQPALRDLTLLRMRLHQGGVERRSWSCLYGERTISISEVGLETS
ncbi:CRISPR-associated helicase/endonuclease Cas3 [Streptomyces gilvosporeus]|uniref:CRISPR-associated helicase/endonuclease Cas3 n=1 Tax=Streptomyces gilvosporeus TaxID=553510 RepID=A0A1V0TZW5_9ACTN|nr:CRISPR-associated helicase/endonuclease Cas3 [Streptomyces gilvosporeus]ARF58338.1 CRISPR-associated helicase/endonuclease Cas3 [Streptomyces gilvosporeus]